MNNFLTRTLSGVVFIAAITGALLGGPLTFYLLFAFITALCLNEFYNLVGTDQADILKLPGLTAGVVVFTLHFMVAGGYIQGYHMAGLLLLPMILWIIEVFRKKAYPLRNLAYTLTGLIYPVLMLSSLAHLTFLPDGEFSYAPNLALALFILIWCNDTFAYITGKGLGKHKLFPRVSPQKSWEGFFGGMVFTLLAAFILFHLLELLPVIHWLALALIVSVAGTIGDLSESYLKRTIGVKESGNLIPGHGGILDRLDAALFVFPTAWFYLSLTIW